MKKVNRYLMASAKPPMSPIVSSKEYTVRSCVNFLGDWINSVIKRGSPNWRTTNAVGFSLFYLIDSIEVKLCFCYYEKFAKKGLSCSSISFVARNSKLCERVPCKSFESLVNICICCFNGVA